MVSKRWTRAGAAFDAIMNWSNLIAGIMVLLIVVVICLNVTLRYGARIGMLGMVQEASAFLLLYITFLAAGPTLRANRHPTMSVVFNVLSPRSQALLRMVNSAILTLLSVWLVFFATGVTINYVANSSFYGASIPLHRAAVSGFIPIGALVLGLQALRMTVDLYRRLRHGEETTARSGGTE